MNLLRATHGLYQNPRLDSKFPDTKCRVHPFRQSRFLWASLPASVHFLFCSVTSASVQGVFCSKGGAAPLWGSCDSAGPPVWKVSKRPHTEPPMPPGRGPRAMGGGLGRGDSGRIPAPGRAVDGPARPRFLAGGEPVDRWVCWEQVGKSFLYRESRSSSGDFSRGGGRGDSVPPSCVPILLLYFSVAVPPLMTVMATRIALTSVPRKPPV